MTFHNHDEEDHKEKFHYAPNILSMARTAAIIKGTTVRAEIDNLGSSKERLVRHYGARTHKAIVNAQLRKEGYFDSYKRRPGDSLYVLRFLYCTKRTERKKREALAQQAKVQ